MKMIMELCWNDTDREKQMYWEKNLYQCHHFVHHKSHTQGRVIEKESAQ
jgi:hypothetical protein